VALRRAAPAAPLSEEEIDMAMQAPTRITIEVHPPEPGYGLDQPTVRVLPESPAATPSMMSQPMAALREAVQVPALYEPGPCRCLDEDDCGADHAND
jgi:hypothetical protein